LITSSPVLVSTPRLLGLGRWATSEFDRNYVDGQVEYQKGNAALFEQEIQNGNDPELKEFARQTLPKIVDHLQRADKLAAAIGG